MLFRLICLMLFCLGIASAQSDTLSLSQASASAGAITLNVSLSSAAGEQPAGVEWTLSYSPADFTAIQVTAGPTATAAGKSVSCAGTYAAYKCIVFGANSNTVADGLLAVVSLTVAPKTSDTTSFVQLQNPVAASVAGSAIPVSGAGVAVVLNGIGISSDIVSFSYMVGGTPPPVQNVHVTHVATGALSWTAAWKAPWLKVSPASGTTPSTVSISVDPAGLATSAYTDTIQIDGGASGGQAAITVTLTVSAAVTPGPATLFVPIVPCRMVDTRNPRGVFGGPAIAPGSTRNFAIPNSQCGIPSIATAYSLNVTVVPARDLGYLSVWPAGQPQPLVATLNSLDGRIKSNAAIVAAGAGGAVSVFATDTTHVILDINGYFVPPSIQGALAFYPVAPCRVADTRNSIGALGGPEIGAQGVRSFPVTQSACAIPSIAEAYSLNLTAVPKGYLGYLTVWPSAVTQPGVSMLNDATGTTVAGAVIVGSGTNGAIDVFATNATNVAIDTNGYFAPRGSDGLSLHNLPPCRILDTRLNGGLPFVGTKTIPVSGSCGVPAAAQAYVLNATVVPAGALGYISLWPQGAPQPLVSTLNAFDGAITNNMAIVPASSGQIEVFSSHPTHLVLDIFGYFAP